MGEQQATSFNLLFKILLRTGSFMLQLLSLQEKSRIEITTYHIALREHLELFKSVQAEYVNEPYPAWTAIEVAGFVRKGAIVEIRAIASAVGALLGMTTGVLIDIRHSVISKSCKRHSETQRIF